MSRIEPDAAASVQALVELLCHADPYVRAKAAASLGQIGARAKPAVDNLLKSLSDDSPVARAAAAALGRSESLRPRLSGIWRRRCNTKTGSPAERPRKAWGNSVRRPWQPCLL